LPLLLHKTTAKAKKQALHLLAAAWAMYTLTRYRESYACKLVQADFWRGVWGREASLLVISAFEAAADGQL